MENRSESFNKIKMYNYSQNNLLEKPCHYMYTPFEGEKFLNNFFISREECMDILYDGINSDMIFIVNWCFSSIEDKICKMKLGNLLCILKKEYLNESVNSTLRLNEA